MKEKGILFNSEMVKAILDGRKDTTRRLNGLHEINKNPDEWTLDSFEMNPVLMAWDKNGDTYPKIMDGLIATFEHNELGEVYRNIKCPYEIGMRLWVRETWGIEGGRENVFFYKADCTDRDLSSGGIFCKETGWLWHPSIYMPREAARLFLTVKDIRIERLQEITEDDAIKEGVGDPYNYQHPEYYDQKQFEGVEINKCAFAGLWDSINLKRGCGWNTNCWVWAVEFEVVK